jgi:hypothetical protein
MAEFFRKKTIEDILPKREEGVPYTIRTLFPGGTTTIRTFNFDLPSNKEVAENKKEEQKASV